MFNFIIGLVVGIVVGALATLFIYRNNKERGDKLAGKIEDTAGDVVDNIKDKINKK